MKITKNILSFKEKISPQLPSLPNLIRALRYSGHEWVNWLIWVEVDLCVINHYSRLWSSSARTRGATQVTLRSSVRVPYVPPSLPLKTVYSLMKDSMQALLLPISQNRHLYCLSSPATKPGWPETHLPSSAARNWCWLLGNAHLVAWQPHFPHLKPGDGYLYVSPQVTPSLHSYRFHMPSMIEQALIEVSLATNLTFHIQRPTASKIMTTQIQLLYVICTCTITKL